MAGSLSVATTAVSLAKVAVVDSGEVGKSTVYSSYNNALGYAHIDWVEFCVLSFSVYEEVSAMQIEF
jgi:hypothetical protein